MPIKFKCPSCDQMLGIARRKSGSVISCPRCSYPATVPQNEGEVARPAAVGRSSMRPAFERGDFDRWIGGRPPGGGTALANPPAAFSSLSETHTGLLDAHRERSKRESSAPVIDIRLAIALILGGGLLAFGGGFWMGRDSAFTKAVATSTPAVNENAKAGAKPDAAGAAATSKYVLTGVIEMRGAGKTVPDAGARILAFPTGQKPLKKVNAGGLPPGEEKGTDQTGIEDLRKIGGVATTADDKGRYSLPLPKEGKYWVLVISKNVTRPGPLMLHEDERGLHQYFADVASLVGNKDFALAIRRAMTNDDGSLPSLSFNAQFTPTKP